MVISPMSPICLLVQILKPMESPPYTSLHSFFFFNSDWVNLPLFWEHWAITWHLSNTASFGCVCMCAMHDLEHNFVQDCAHAVACFASCLVCTCVLMRVHMQRMTSGWLATELLPRKSKWVPLKSGFSLMWATFYCQLELWADRSTHTLPHTCRCWSADPHSAAALISV